MTDLKPNICRINLRLRPGEDDDLLWFLGRDVAEVTHTKRCWGHHARNFQLYRLADLYLEKGFSGIETGDCCVTDRRSGYIDVAFRISNTMPTLYRYCKNYPSGPARASAIRLLFRMVCSDIRGDELKVSGSPEEQVQPMSGMSDNQRQEAGGSQCSSAHVETLDRDEEPDYGPLGRATPEMIDLLQGWGEADWIEPPDDWIEPPEDY